MTAASLFGRMPDGTEIEEVTIGAGDLSASIITLGAVIRDIRLAGVAHPLVLGFDTLEDYLAYSPHFGALVGRSANRIADGRGSGVYVHDGATGTFEDNDITGSGLAGVEVRDGGDPIMRRNRIPGGAQGGLFVHTDGGGRFEHNEITGNGLTGVEVATRARPLVQGNRIADNGESGVFVHAAGRGRFAANDITGNGRSGVEVMTDATPEVVGNRIRKNRGPGVSVEGGGGGVFHDNQLEDNGGGAWQVAPDAGPVDGPTDATPPPATDDLTI